MASRLWLTVWRARVTIPPGFARSDLQQHRWHVALAAQQVMSQYILRRLVLIVPTFLVVSVLVFAMLRLIPGDVIDIMSQGDPNRATADALRTELGLDTPAPYQYFVWLGNILQGDADGART
jgi:hypothetical protein